MIAARTSERLACALLACAVLGGTVLIGGCRTFSAPNARDVVGLVTTTTGEPVAGAQVRIGYLTRATTDAFGRFYLHEVSPGQHRVRAGAAGHEEIDTLLDMPERAQLLHIQLPTLTELIDLAIAAAVRNDQLQLARLAARSAAIDPEDERVRLVQALVARLAAGGLR